MDIFIKNTKKYSIMKGKKKKKSENVGHSIIKKKNCYVMISGAKASLPKMQN